MEIFFTITDFSLISSDRIFLNFLLASNGNVRLTLFVKEEKEKRKVRGRQRK